MRGKLFRVKDAFAEFGFERRPWLEPVILQSRYHELAALRHPDKCGGDPLPMTRLNTARHILAVPSTRLLHLLELTGRQPMGTKNFSPDFEWFARVGSLAKKATTLCAGKPSSPLALAVRRAEIAALQKEISRRIEETNKRIFSLEKTLRALDSRWPDVTPDEIRTLADEFPFVTKGHQLLRDAQTLLLGG